MALIADDGAARAQRAASEVELSVRLQPLVLRIVPSLRDVATLADTREPADVHDVLVPLWLHKADAAKAAAGKVLRSVLGDTVWMQGAEQYFVARDKAREMSRGHT